MRKPAGGGGHSQGFDVSGGLAFSPDGVWRSNLPRPTRAQRRVLAELARGDSLIIDQPDGGIRFRQSGAVVARQVAERLARLGWITAPAGSAPLFNWPSIDGEITAAGRAAFIRGSKA